MQETLFRMPGSRMVNLNTPTEYGVSQDYNKSANSVCFSANTGLKYTGGACPDNTDTNYQAYGGADTRFLRQQHSVNFSFMGGAVRAVEGL